MAGIAKWTKLHSLDLAGCSKVTDVGFGIIGKVREAGSANVENIVLSDARLDNKYHAESAFSFQACPGLYHVNLSRTACTDLTVSLLAHGPQQLKHLDISHTTCTDLGILQLAALCQSTLTELECSWVNGVTDVSILAVARVCHQLLKLFVRDCFFVTEVSMEALARLQPKCQVFDGYRCKLAG